MFTLQKYIKYLITLAIIALIGVLFYTKVYIPKTTFKILSPSVGSLNETIKGIGNVSAKDIYPITAQTGGRVLKVNTDVGHYVKKGDLLLVMDGVDLEEQLEVAKESLEKSHYDRKALQDELANQIAQKRLLEITYKRNKKLKSQNFASQSEFDKAKTNLDAMQASINATKARIGSAHSAIKIALKNIDVIEAKIKRLKVYAPVDGYVVERSVEVGQSVTPSTPLLKIVDTKTLWVETKIDERVSASIKVGQKAKIRLRSEPNKVYEGIVKRIDAVSDAVTFERVIDVGFVHNPQPFYINEQAEVRVALKSYSNLVKIPSSVVVQNGGKSGVWTLQNGHAKFVKIQIIAQTDDAVGVSNLTKNIKIIVPDAKKKALKNGMKIHE